MTETIQALAHAGRMIPRAAVQASCSIVIDASVERTWDLLTDVRRWPDWYSYLKNAKLAGGFVPGTALTYGGLVKHHLTIAKVEPRELAMIYGTLMGYTAITRWDVERTGDKRTTVTFTESSVGPLLALLYSKRGLEGHLDRWLSALKVAAERVQA